MPDNRIYVTLLPMQTTPPTEKASLLVLLLLLVDSLHFVFARLIEPYLPPSAGAMYVLSIAAVEIALFMAVRQQIRWQVFRQHLWFFGVIGLLVAASTTVNYTAVSFVDPGTASLLSQTSIVFAMLFGVAWLREKLNWQEWLGAGVALAGVFIISFQPIDRLQWGALLVLSSSFMYALHAAVVKRYGGGIEFTNFFLFRVACTAVFLIIFAAARQQLVIPPLPAWPYLVLAGTVDVVISRVLYYQVLRRLQMSYHAILLTLSPVVTILWSLLLFQTWPTRYGWGGGTAVLIGIFIVTQSRRKG